MSHIKSIPLWVCLVLTSYFLYFPPTYAHSIVLCIFGALYGFEIYFYHKRLAIPEEKEPTELDKLKEEQEIEQVKLNIERIKAHHISNDQKAVNKPKERVLWA